MRNHTQQMRSLMTRKPAPRAQAHSGVALFIGTLTILIALVAPLRAQTSNTPAEFAYVANSASNNVSVYRVDSGTGVLTQVGGSPFPAGSVPQSIAIDPFGRFAYVANYASNDISAYAIDVKTGRLTQITGSPFAGGGGPACVAINPTGGFAYVTNILANSVSVYAVNPASGSLKEIAGSPFAAGTSPISVTVDSMGHFVYVANLDSNDISAYAIQTDSGDLVPIVGSPFAAGVEPFSVTVDPLNRFAYAANDVGNVSAYSVDRITGALTQISGSPFAAGDWSIPVAVDPSGRFAYVGAGSDGTYATPGYVAGYSIDASTGALTPVPGSPFAAGIAPWSVAVDPSGKFVYAANVFITSSNLSAYTLNSDSGALTPVPGSPFVAGRNPNSVKVVRIGIATSTSLLSSLNPSTYGKKVTWTATVTSSGSITPTGKVRFTWSGYTIGSATLNSSGVATLTRANLNADSYPLTAVYLGDATNLGSTSALLNQVVLETTSTAKLTSSPNPSTQGQAVTFTAKISSPTVIPTGPVTFTSGKTVLATAQLSGGKATLTISSLPVGSSKITVTYYGDSNIAKSSASVTQTVQ